MKTVIQYELTDTYCGEANYSWIKRGTIDTREGEEFSDTAAIRRVKKALGWEGWRCSKSSYGDMIELRPSGACLVCFITFHTFGNASAQHSKLGV